MIQFDKPAKLNGQQLLNELNAAHVKVDKFPVIEADGTFWLDVKETDKTKAATVIAAHVGVETVIELTVEEKLASVGLTINDLKIALGI